MSLLRDGFLQGDGVYLVEASAGTGKTHTMVETAVDLMLEGRIVGKPERLLAVTFTRAATAELKERLRAALYAARENPAQRDNPKLAEALASMDRLAVTTIHGFCTGVLEEFALECGVPVGLRFLDDISEYVDRAVADEWRTLTWPESRESEIVIGALIEGRTDEWSPAALRKAAMAVRGAIGAQHPPRLESRAEAFQGFADAAAIVAQQFDEVALREFVQKVQWNKDGLSEDSLPLLSRAVQAIREGRVPAVSDLRPWTLESVNGTNSRVKKKINDPLIAAQPILASIQTLVEQLDAAAESLWADAVLGVVERLEQAMAHDRVAGFDDMIRMVERALTGPDGAQLRKVLHERYDVVLVDEFQDTDWAQWRIFSTAFSKRPLVLVGDPKQSIYGFRGADIFAYLEAKTAAATAGRVKPLAVNWRSDPGVVRGTAVFFEAPEPFAMPRERLDFQPVTAQRKTPTLTGYGVAPVVLVEAGKSTAEQQEARIANYIAGEVTRLLAHDTLMYSEKEGGEPRKLRANDIAVLVRTNKQGAAIVDALRERRVSAVTTATGDVSESDTWRDMLALIAAVEDPSDDRAVRRALVTPFGGCDAAHLAALVSDATQWRLHIDRLVQARRDWSRRGVLTALTRLMADPLWDSVARLARRTDAERRLTDLRHILGLLQRAERDGHRTPSSLVTWARRFADRSAEEKETRALHLETDREAVQITTIHAAKGLEWPVVFCPYLWKKGMENDNKARLVRRKDGARWIRFSSEPYEDELLPDTELSESLRLAYVALTRARARLYVVNGADGSTSKAVAPLAHLLAAHGDDPGAVLASRSADIALVRLESLPESDEQTLAQSEEKLKCEPALRPLQHAQTRSWSVSSYTALTASASSAAAPVTDEPGPVDDPEASAPSDDPALRADQLPGGAHVGNALHTLFERFDFPRLNDAAYRDAAINEVMESYALPRAGADTNARTAAAELVQRMLTHTLSTPITGAAKPLSAVPMGETLREWRFHLPVEGTSAAALAEAFKRAGEGWIAEEYAPRLARLSSRELRGFLTGVVDLVLRMDGQWWIVDWKSNTLGPTGTSYAEARCREEMIDTHYVLQYHLYAVALHRFLRNRVEGYDYARDFGGVGYAFLRGLAMGVPAWFHDRPSPALIDALDAALGGGRA